LYRALVDCQYLSLRFHDTIDVPGSYKEMAV
jgi:hypothetical protein